MTQAAVTPYVFHITDAAEDTFSFPFHIDAASELKAYLDENAVSNFTVAGVGNAGGGTITFTSPPAAGVLFLYRATPQDQLTDYVANDPFSAESHEAALDHIVRMIQDISESLSRRPALAQYTAQALRNLTLPPPGASKAIGWNQAGSGLVLYDTDDLGSIAEAELIHRDGSVAYTAPPDFGSQPLQRIGSANAQILSGTVHPAQSPGVPASQPAYYFRKNETTTPDSAGQLWMKRGPADTDWSLVAPVVFTPDDFGAEGTGQVDDSAAFLAADAYFKDQLDVANQWGTGVLWIPDKGPELAGAAPAPKGSYRLDQDVTLSYTSLMGTGWSVIDLAGASNTLAIDPVAAGVPGDGFEMMMSGIVFRATVATRTGDAPLLRIDNGNGPFTLSMCRFQVPGAASGVQFDTGDRSIISACQFQLQPNATGVVNTGATRLVVTGTTVRGSTNTVGIELRAGSSQTTISPSVVWEAVTTRVLDNSGSPTYITPRTVIAQGTWAPGAIGADATITEVFTVPGATIGEAVSWGITPSIHPKVRVLPNVEINGQVHLTLHNQTGGSHDPGALTVTLVVFDTSDYF